MPERRLLDTTDECKGARMRADPVGIRRAEHGDEQLCRPRLATQSVEHGKRRAGVINKHALAGDMALAHGRRQPPLPGAIELAIASIGVTVGVNDAMLLPQQLQRHPWPTQLAAPRPSGPRQRPAQAGTPRPPQALPGGGRAHPKAGGDLAFGHAGGGQPQHVADFAHG
jgi:hypothetical protein